MFKGPFKHNPYMHTRMKIRANRNRANLGDLAEKLQVTFMLEIDVLDTYADPPIWMILINWLEERKIKYFTYKLYTDDHRRGFSFVDPKDAMLFKLTWKDAPANGWERSS